MILEKFSQLDCKHYRPIQERAAMAPSNKNLVKTNPHLLKRLQYMLMDLLCLSKNLDFIHENAGKLCSCELIESQYDGKERSNLSLILRSRAET